MTETAKKRGRPREFDPAEALVSAGKAFRRQGYTGTSLDALASAMKLNKPSLYAAFGDKHALFMRVLEARFRMVGERYQAAFEKGGTLEEALRNVFEAAVEVCLGEGGPPGCPVAAAALGEAFVDEEIGEFARMFRVQTDKGIARWIRSKRGGEGEREGEGGMSSEGLARLANGILHDIAIRARVGESRAKLREIGRDAARVLALAAGQRA